MSARPSQLRWIFLLLRWLWIAAASLCILAALLVGVLRLLMPLAPEFTQQMAQRLSVATGREISIDHIECDWVQGGPMCKLRDVAISGTQGTPGIVLPNAELALNVFLWAFTDQRLLELRVSDADLSLSRDDNGVWGAEALGVAWPDNPQSQTDLPLLLKGARFTIVDSILRVRDAKRDRQLNLYVNAVSVSQQAAGVHLSGRLAPLNEQNASLDFIFDSSTPTNPHQGLPYDLYLETRGFPLSALTDVPEVFGFDHLTGALDMQLWAEVQDGQLRLLHGNAALEDLRIRGADLSLPDKGPIMPVYGVNMLNADFEWRREENKWRLEFPRLRIERENTILTSSAAIVHLDEGTQAPDQLQIANFRSEDIADLLVTSAEIPLPLRQALYQLAPHGVINSLQLKAATDNPLDPVAHLRLQGEEMSWSAFSGIPGMTGVSLDLLHRGQSGEAALRLNAGSFHMRDTLPNRVFVDTGLVQVHWLFDEWLTLDIAQARFLGDGYDIALGGNLTFPELHQRPVLDLQMRARDVDLQKLDRFYVKHLPDGARRWLLQAFRGGKLSNLEAVFRADLNDPDFDTGNTRLQVRADAEDVVMHYQKGWPLYFGDAQVAIDNLALMIRGNGSVQNMAIDAASARMDDMRVPEMWVDVSGHGSGSAPLELVRVSPIGNKLAGDLSAIQLEGDVNANVQLHIPLKKNSPWKTRVDGTLQISDNALQLPRWNIDFEQLQGQAKFDRFGLKAEQLSAVFSGTDVDLDVAIGESVEEEGLRLTTSVTGQLSASQFAQLYPPIQDLAMRIEGQSPWQVELGLGENGAPGRLHLSSNLVGTQLYLPQPLSKNMDTPLSFTLDSVFPLDDQPIALQLGTKTQAILRILPQGFAANIAFDAGEPEIPESPGVTLQGNVATLDWSDWVSDLPELFPAGSNQTVELRHADLVIQALNAFGRTFPDVHMVLDRDGTEYAVVIDAEHSRGNLRVPVEVNSSTTISGQFQSLFWPESEGNASTVDHPRDMPSLNLVSDQTLWGDLDLGQVQIATYPTPNGLEVDNFEARSQALHIKGSGSWLRNANGDTSQFSARMTAEDGGVLLRKLGFESYLVGGQTIAEMDVRWPGTLAAMDAKRMNGRLSLEIGQGKIPDLDTGAGRLLGLVSLQALPRRLSLDFSDLFETGLVFDRIEGALQLRSGDIYTDDLLLVGPTADILIAGRIGLVQRDYELLAKVRPKVGGALSIFGAIAGGGVGAAAMMLFGNALNDPISKASEVQYWVTGGFDNPTIAPAQGVVPPAAAPLPPTN